MSYRVDPAWEGNLPVPISKDNYSNVTPWLFDRAAYACQEQTV